MRDALRLFLMFDEPLWYCIDIPNLHPRYFSLGMILNALSSFKTLNSVDHIERRTGFLPSLAFPGILVSCSAWPHSRGLKPC